MNANSNTLARVKRPRSFLVRAKKTITALIVVGLTSVIGISALSYYVLPGLTYSIFFMGKPTAKLVVKGFYIGMPFNQATALARKLMQPLLDKWNNGWINDTPEPDIIRLDKGILDFFSELVLKSLGTFQFIESPKYFATVQKNKDDEKAIETGLGIRLIGENGRLAGLQLGGLATLGLFEYPIKATNLHTFSKDFNSSYNTGLEYIVLDNTKYISILDIFEKKDTGIYTAFHESGVRINIEGTTTFTITMYSEKPTSKRFN